MTFCLSDSNENRPRITSRMKKTSLRCSRTTQAEFRDVDVGRIDA
jgi:hypothetical protein